jgi:RNA-directed DNA polymerase
MPSPAFYSTLARSFLAGEASLEPIVARASQTLGRNWRWLRPLGRRYLNAFGSGARPRRRNVIRFLKEDEGLFDAVGRYRAEIRIAGWKPELHRMQPVRAAGDWKIPLLESMGALAGWLQVTPSELAWFADLKRLTSRGRAGEADALNHYHYRLLAKEGGAVRLIEVPKKRLKEMQRKILTGILEAIPIHEAAHGFRKGRSIKTFVAPHVGRRIVLRMDLRDFFPSIRGGRVQAFFRTAGYPEPVADLLGGICTNAAPRSLSSTLGKGLNTEQMADARALYAWPHLPQGAPTSPALANLCAYRVDCRLSGLADSVGVSYTRYADDLAFSGDNGFERSVERFAAQVAAILLEDGFAVHHRKTRIMRQGVRQYLAGLVTNERVNVVRTDFDRLKAILTNCARQGPESQNRENHPLFRMHLAGRVGFVEMVNPVKGARLRRIFNQIRW